MAMMNSTTAQTPETLKAKEAVLARVRAELAKARQQLPALAATAKGAAEKLEKAKLDVFVAAGTPGFEDDRAAAASVAVAQAELDAACELRDAADDRLDFLKRAEAQLQREVGEIQGALHRMHLERSKGELRAKVAGSAPALEALIQVIATLRTLEGRTSWPQEIHLALQDVLQRPEDRDPRPDRLQLAIRAGHASADRIRAGAAVTEACP